MQLIHGFRCNVFLACMLLGCYAYCLFNMFLRNRHRCQLKIVGADAFFAFTNMAGVREKTRCALVFKVYALDSWWHQCRLIRYQLFLKSAYLSWIGVFPFMASITADFVVWFNFELSARATNMYLVYNTARCECKLWVSVQCQTHNANVSIHNCYLLCTLDVHATFLSSLGW